MKKIIKIFIDSKYRFNLLNKYGLYKNMTDKDFLIKKYKKMIGKSLNLENPQTFNEKMQWLKLYDRKELYTTLVDKYEVKKYIANMIGEEYIIPTIGIYSKFDDIDFKKLPNSFVIKCTHDSGGLVIVKDKSKMNIKNVKRKINKSLHRNFYYIGREWPYKKVEPRIIIEKYMSNGNKDLEDYKIHCFNGSPKIILVCKDRYDKSGLTEDFFDIDWNHLNIKRTEHGNSIKPVLKPSKLDEMLELSKKISTGFPFLRIDFYVINNKVYFGEITFYPASGFNTFEPEKWDYTLGQWIDIKK